MEESQPDPPAFGAGVALDPDVDYAEEYNGRLGSFNQLIGLRFIRATLDEMVVELTVTEDLLQPYGILHGGVHAAVVETVASSGAAMTAFGRNQTVVGLENTTSFIRAVRPGCVLRATGRPLTRGRRSHVWEVRVEGDDGKLVSTGRVRMLCLESGAEIAGEVVQVKG